MPSIAEILAASKGKALKSPIMRARLGLETTNPVATPNVQQKTQQNTQQKNQPQLPSAAPEIFKRILVADNVGYGKPGPGTIPGSALRKDVRDLFEELGGAVAIDISNLSPQEEQQLAMILEPGWAARHAGL